MAASRSAEARKPAIALARDGFALAEFGVAEINESATAAQAAAVATRMGESLHEQAGGA